jgi:uncharacterized protein with ATP-grasp and redox domains
MKISIECVPCLLKRIIFETEINTNDSEIKKNIIKNVCSVLSELYDPSKSSASIATMAHKIAYETLGIGDPYKDLKMRSNEIAKELIPLCEEYIECSDDPLRISIICSIIGNMMDFGIEGASENPEFFKEIFEEKFVEDLGFDDTDDLKVILSRSQNVVFFTDNCGEIVFDKLLCRELKRFNPNIKLTLVVKGEPIISDATLDDAEELNFKEYCDEILTTGCFAIGLDINNIPEELEKRLINADIIICKGMANYEAFSETNFGPIAYLLRTKCKPIASSMKLPLNINAVKIYH